ncbi:MarR family winged helix-turn-helix transcriptional regulator [Arsenicicoccus sp. oral taxon 190]|uniref:MarR family winged helix-turn-helix transcriptional regulator n=1 Tax=Arsenicicoccus sp. oral taxon 190 TaxID=1658671 RepID=UPI00067A3E9B|nr:MarR family transcriptional regulator [Arsenicicoccus sp. oral taxon 190]AKT52060.1 hypothetical protein ADJ73_13635 [Arsenicicoccus sp. oral taxon 190]
MTRDPRVRAADDPAVVDLLDALTPLLVRRFREGVYQRLQGASPVRLSDGTYPILTALLSGPASAAQVAARVGVDRTVVTKQASTLQRAGLVARRPDPGDARATLLVLTPAGEEAAAGLRRAALQLIGELSTTGVDPGALAQAAAVLRALTEVVQAGAPGERT